MYFFAFYKPANFKSSSVADQKGLSFLRKPKIKFALRQAHLDHSCLFLNKL